jgi:hypothetical protein
VTGQQITRATLTDPLTGDTLQFQFNPESLTRTKSALWRDYPTNDSSDQPRPQYVGQGSESLSGKLLFDDFDLLGNRHGSVATSVRLLFGWLTISDQAEHKNTPRPPKLVFQWGDGVSFTGVLKHVSVQYLRFDPNGRPTRAVATINLQATPDNPKHTNPTSGGLPGRTSAQLGEGDTLASIAYQHYGDPNLWRAIAVTNGISDPGRVPIGTRLLVPRRADAEALNAGEARHG